MKKFLSFLLITVFLFISVFTTWLPVGAETVTTKVENNDSTVVYSGNWVHETSSTAAQSSGQSHHYTFEAGAYAELTFYGTSIKVYGKKGPAAGMGYFFIDDMENPVASVNTKGNHEYQVLFFEKNDLPLGEHTIRVQNDPDNNTAFNLDFFVIEYEEEPEVNKTALNEKIAEALSLNEADFTAESWNVLEAALNNARIVAADEDATQEDVDNVLAELTEAIKGLVRTGDIQIPYYIIDFENNQPGDWKKVVGNATIEARNGMLKVVRDTSANNMVVLVDNNTPDLTDGEIEIMFRLDNSAARFGIVFRTGTAPNSRWGFAGYSIEDNWLIETGTSSGEQWIDNIKGPILQTGKTYVMKVRFVGTTITIWLDGQQIYSGDVSYKLTNLPKSAGKIGLRSWFDQKTAWIEYIKYGEVGSLPDLASLGTTNVSTMEGTAPVLPDKIKAIYSDGTSTMVPVTWGTINPDLYADEGTFTVEGSVPGTSIKATANVTVNPLPQISAVLKGAEYAVIDEDYSVTFGVDTEVDIAALDVTITYDPDKFEFVNVESVLDGAVIAGYSADDPGTVRVLIGTEGEDKAINGQKEVFLVTLKPVKTFVSNIIRAVNIEVSDGEGSVFYPDNVSLTVAMEGQVIPGDVNGDGEITIGDVGIAAKYFGYEEGNEDWQKAKKADVDGNGRIDIIDLVFIARKLLGLE